MKIDVNKAILNKLNEVLDMTIETNLKALNNLSQQDFEKEKSRLIEEYISSLPEERQLKARQLQWVLDCKLSRYKNPLVRAQVAYNMMIESLNELNSELQKWKINTKTE